MGRRRWFFPVLAALLVGTVAVREAQAHSAARPVYYIGTRSKVMALTFDVSWGSTMLPKVLAVLNHYHQAATFFVSGPWAKRYPSAIKAILAGGNELASHGQAHVNLSGHGPSAIANNVSAADTVLRQYTSAPIRFFRPPNGDFNHSVVDTASGLGYETVIWSIDSRDWLNPGVGVIAHRVLSGAFPGAIILLHASDTCKQTDLALPAIFAGLQKQGYRLTTLGTLWAMGPAMRTDPRGSGQRPNLDPPTGTSPSHSASVTLTPRAAA